MFEASIGKLVAVSKMEETKSDGSSVTGTIGTVAGGVLRKLDTREVGVSRIDETKSDGRRLVSTAVGRAVTSPSTELKMDDGMILAGRSVTGSRISEMLEISDGWVIRVVGTAVGTAPPSAVAVERMLDTTELGRFVKGTEAGGVPISDVASLKMLETCDGCRALVGTTVGTLDRTSEIKLVGTADNGTDCVVEGEPPRIEERRPEGITLKIPSSAFKVFRTALICDKPCRQEAQVCSASAGGKSCADAWANAGADANTSAADTGTGVGCD